MRDAVVIEKEEVHHAAYVPELPGCVATGKSLEEVELDMREAIALRIDAMRQDRPAIPQPTSMVEYVELAA